MRKLESNYDKIRIHHIKIKKYENMKDWENRIISFMSNIIAKENDRLCGRQYLRKND